MPERRNGGRPKSKAPPVTLILGGELYDPEPRGRRDLLLCGEKVLKIGDVDRRALDQLGVHYDVIDARGHVVTPGFIDAHQHLLGGSGEEGFSSQSPEFFVGEIVRYGITTSVGTLGVDTTMKTMAGLLGKVKALREEGLTAYCWSGGYNVPPTAIMESVRDDILFIDEVIGAGEIAISDERASDPEVPELAKVVHDAYVGGKLSKKAGLTHFHVGEGERRMRCIRELLDPTRFQVKPEWLYVTHVERNEKLMDEAIELAGAGVAVDLDVVEGGLAKWLRYYLDRGGDPSRITASSDAGKTSPKKLYDEVCGTVVRHRLPLELVLALVTSNPARILKLETKGHLTVGSDADVVVMSQGSLDLAHVIARGQRMVADGDLCARPGFAEESDREIELVGEQAG